MLLTIQGPVSAADFELPFGQAQVFFAEPGELRSEAAASQFRHLDHRFEWTRAEFGSPTQTGGFAR